MADTDKKYACPNCGGKVAPSLDVFGPDGKVDEELQVSPKGNVGVCQDCNMAVSTTSENLAENVSVALGEGVLDENDPTWNPRTLENPPRSEDDLLWDPSQGGSTSPEVPLEASVPDPESTEVLTPPETTVLATDPIGEADQPQQ